MKSSIIVLTFMLLLFAIPMGCKADEAVVLKEGDKAPEFSAVSDTGEIVSLKDFIGGKVVLYFYPKDDTPGCTMEACSFRDGFSEIEKAGATILGVSLDNKESHQKFKKKYNLPFTLLVDNNGEISKKYGVYKEYVPGILKLADRVTFLIDEKGIIRKIFNKVDVSRHADEIKAELKVLEKEGVK